MIRCPACSRVVLATPHLTDDRLCAGIAISAPIAASPEPIAASPEPIAASPEPIAAPVSVKQLLAEALERTPHPGNPELWDRIDAAIEEPAPEDKP